MALTRPTFDQTLSTKIEITDPVVMINKGGNTARDLGFLIDRSYLAQSNIAIVFKHSDQTLHFITTDGGGNTDGTFATNTNVDVSMGNISAGNISLSGNIILSGGSTQVTGNLLPSGNLVYDLGSNTNRWRDLFLSGNTINLGGATIKTDANSGAIALIPPATVSNPNPTGVVFSPAGTISTVTTSGGTVSGNAISESSNNAASSGNTSFGNIVASGNITSNGYIIGNGSLLTGISSSGSGNYSNTNVASYLATHTGNISGTITTAAQPNITSLGTLSSLTVTGNLTAGNLSGTLLTGTITTSAQPNITSLGTLSSLSVTGNISSSANISANHFVGNGSALTGINAGLSNARAFGFSLVFGG